MTISDMMPTRLVEDWLHPDEVARAVARGARVVDIRSQAERSVEGPLVGAVALTADEVIDRLDPGSPARIGWAVDHDVEWILVSARGHDAVVLVDGLRGRGVRGAMALIGGFSALRALRLLEAVSGGLHNRRDAAAIAAH